MRISLIVAVANLELRYFKTFYTRAQFSVTLAVFALRVCIVDINLAACSLEFMDCIHTIF